MSRFWAAATTLYPGMALFACWSLVLGGGVIYWSVGHSGRYYINLLILPLIIGGHLQFVIWSFMRIRPIFKGASYGAARITIPAALAVVFLIPWGLLAFFLVTRAVYSLGLE